MAPTDITADNYLAYAARYRIGDIQVPPAAKLVKTLPVELEATASNPTDGYEKSWEDRTRFDLVGASDSQQAGVGLELPSGYRLTSWTADVLTYRVPDWEEHRRQ